MTLTLTANMILSMRWSFEPRTIEGARVQLEPLEQVSLQELCLSLIPDPDGWYSVMFDLNSPDAYRKELQDAADYRRKRVGIGYAIRDLASSEIAGISFFLKMDEENRTLEIGTTNIAPRFRRTHVNTATKFAMLEEAFERLGCIRVSFRVDEENTISRRAVERLGAIYGGTLRHERILPDGRVRDYCFYSIIDREWPMLKTRLRSLLDC